MSPLLIDSIKHFPWKTPYKKLLTTGTIISQSCIWGIKCSTLFHYEQLLQIQSLSSRNVSFKNIQVSDVVSWLVDSLAFFLPTYSFLQGYWLHFLNFSPFFFLTYWNLDINISFFEINSYLKHVRTKLGVKSKPFTSCLLPVPGKIDLETRSFLRTNQ